MPPFRELTSSLLSRAVHAGATTATTQGDEAAHILQAHAALIDSSSQYLSDPRLVSSQTHTVRAVTTVSTVYVRYHQCQ
jgi:hypothetical protein